MGIATIVLKQFIAVSIFSNSTKLEHARCTMRRKIFWTVRYIPQENRHNENVVGFDLVGTAEVK
jgi:hypothetical protein